MALENFIPTIWSARLLENLQKALVYGQAGIVNRDYEGEIRDVGDTVRINAIGAVTVSDYTKNTDINAPETLQDASLLLRIEKAKYFNFAVDDVDRVQQKPKVMDAAMRESAYALRDVADQYIAAQMVAGAGVKWGTDASPKVLDTAVKAYELLVDVGIELDKVNVPRAGRWAVVPPWVYGLFLKDDRFVKAGTTRSDQVLANGEMGQAAGFTILESNNVPVSSNKYRVLAGVPQACSYAEQVLKVEAYRPERRFADAVKGLHVYGAKVVRSQALCLAICSVS
jgi:N4-gp56 family major capsid protein